MALLLGEVVRRHARHRPEKTAYVIGPHRVSYRRLDTTANRLAHALRGLGVRHGDRVATLAHNRVEYPAIYFAVAKLGGAPADVSFQSSNRWDIAGAKAYGLRCVWVNRLGAPDEYPDLRPDRTVRDLRALLDA